MNRQELNLKLPGVVESLVKSVQAEPQMQHLNRIALPSRDAIVEAIGLLRQVVFPGYFGKQGITATNMTYRLGELVTELADSLYEQVRCCLRYREQIEGANGGDERCQKIDE